jgi:hypothetical protein
MSRIRSRQGRCWYGRIPFDPSTKSLTLSSSSHSSSSSYFGGRIQQCYGSWWLTRFLLVFLFVQIFTINCIALVVAESTSALVDTESNQKGDDYHTVTLRGSSSTITRSTVTTDSTTSSSKNDVVTKANVMLPDLAGDGNASNNNSNKDNNNWKGIDTAPDGPDVPNNLQVLERVHDRLNDFMTQPVQIANRAAKFRSIGGFPSDMDATDRKMVQQFFYIDQPALVYYGLEDGTFILYDVNGDAVSYREPGNSGYDGINIPSDMEQYYSTCVDSFDGTPKNCTLEAGEQYVSCVNDCEYIPCSDLDAQELSEQFSTNCTTCEETNTAMNQTTATTTSSTSTTTFNVTWCQNYVIQETGPNETLGYIPRTKSCINERGEPEQTPGRVLISAQTMEYGSCYYQDDKTVVNRTIRGPYQHCQPKSLHHLPGDGIDLVVMIDDKVESDDMVICNDTFEGGFDSTYYDPRFRGWYIGTKREQEPIWTDPYPFFDGNDIGITYSMPIYSYVVTNTTSESIVTINSTSPRKVFVGVIAVVCIYLPLVSIFSFIKQNLNARNI